MAVGDMASDLQSIANNATFDIQPAGTVEWIIHNVYHEGNVEVQRFNGTTQITCSLLLGQNVETNLQFHAGNTQRIRLKNVSGATQSIGYDGIISHV